ncbi:MAG: glycosyltransferase [Candidatus Omnitrophica bacterium]|nr:glycosyltransferase [Candidatus Omnitrophota bacterium]MBU4479162.1 glycosyltransferase [Candidatus Omnitrophota bacterium]MCG2703791.1 glycosyltransferase [Candidatus Omnitrophota bacterium]
MQKPFYSIIIPTYNRKIFLKKAVASVLAQSLEDFELIIIDDGSTDSTRSFIDSLSDPRLKYIRQEHQGVSAARNNAIKASRGCFIAFLDSDDWFKPQKLKITHQYILKHPDYRIFHTEEIWYRNGILLAQKAIHRKPDGYVFEQSLKLCCISISAAAVKKELFDAIGLFDETMPACEDYDFWLRATARYPVKLIPEALTLKKGGHLDQLSKRYPCMDKFRIYAIKKILDSAALAPEQRKAAVRELARKCLIYIKGAEKRYKHKEIEYYKDIISTYNTQEEYD